MAGRQQRLGQMCGAWRRGQHHGQPRAIPWRRGQHLWWRVTPFRLWATFWSSSWWLQWRRQCWSWRSLSRLSWYQWLWNGWSRFMIVIWMRPHLMDSSLKRVSLRLTEISWHFQPGSNSDLRKNHHLAFDLLHLSASFTGVEYLVLNFPQIEVGQQVQISQDNLSFSPGQPGKSMSYLTQCLHSNASLIFPQFSKIMIVRLVYPTNGSVLWIVETSINTGWFEINLSVTGWTGGPRDTPS